MMLLDAQGRIKKYVSTEDILVEFYSVRLEAYNCDTTSASYCASKRLNGSCWCWKTRFVLLKKIELAKLT